MLTLIEDWLKSALLEIQEYVRLQMATLRGCVTGPFYFHDIVEQFEQIGIGSLTVVVLTGFFTGAALALQSGMTLEQIKNSIREAGYIPRQRNVFYEYIDKV